MILFGRKRKALAQRVNSLEGYLGIAYSVDDCNDKKDCCCSGGSHTAEEYGTMKDLNKIIKERNEKKRMERKKKEKSD